MVLKQFAFLILLPTVFAITTETITLNNDIKIPIVGLGTLESVGDGVYEAVKDAIESGYRLIDTAFMYGNEKDIGRAINESIFGKTITREEVFVVSKVWHTYHSRARVIENLKMSLQDLRLKYVDLYLIHFPFGLAEGTNQLKPVDSDGNVLFSNVDYLDTWLGMEDAVNQGLAKSIGLSNFNSKQIDRVLGAAKIRPVVNQVECHPYLNQQQLLEFCAERHIKLMAYSPLGKGSMLEEEKIVAIADRHNASAAQVLIRYQIQRGVIVIPKSSNRTRIAENYSVFGFSLTEKEMMEINSLNKNLRYNTVEYAQNHTYYPFNIPF